VALNLFLGAPVPSTHAFLAIDSSKISKSEHSSKVVGRTLSLHIVAMLGDKKKSSNRLSGLFSKSSDTSESGANKHKSPTPTEPTNRLTKVRNRLSSATHLAPDYPPPQASNAQRPASLANPTIQPVESLESTANLAPLEPPPPLTAPGSRNVSPSGKGSRPGTPGADSGSEGNLKKLRRRSKLFGGSQMGDGLTGGGSAPAAQDSPHAWIVGHKGKVPYNLAMLLNGEKVSGRLGAHRIDKRAC
jgi:hypothetical protein